VSDVVWCVAVCRRPDSVRHATDASVVR